jgi:predicted nucleic acid-binding Zn ribbon protein
MEGIEAILPRVLRRLGATRQVRQVRVEAAFAKVCGEYIRPHVRVYAVERSVLVLACAHPAIAHQLQIEAATILDSINAEVGGRVLTRLRFVPEAGTPPAPRPPQGS